MGDFEDTTGWGTRARFLLCARGTGRVASQPPERETSPASPGFQAVRQGAEAGRAGGVPARPMVDACGRIRRTHGIDAPEFRDLPFPPDPGPSVPGPVVQHAIHTVPQSGELPGSVRKGVESLMLDYLFPEMRFRNTTDKERMDRADADPDRLRRTIRQFRWINFLFSASRALLREHIFSM